MANFSGLYYQLQNWGFIDVLLPFLMIFAVVFGILEKIKLFGDDKKNINIVISLTFGFLFIAPHLMGMPATKDPVAIMMKAIPNVGVLLGALVLLLILIGFWLKGEFTLEGHNVLSTIVFLGSVGVILYIFGKAAGWWNGAGWPRWLSFMGNGNAWAVILSIGVFIAGILLITSGGKSEKPLSKMNLKDLGKGFSNFFGGK